MCVFATQISCLLLLRSGSGTVSRTAMSATLSCKQRTFTLSCCAAASDKAWHAVEQIKYGAAVPYVASGHKGMPHLEQPVHRGLFLVWVGHLVRQADGGLVELNLILLHQMEAVTPGIAVTDMSRNTFTRRRFSQQDRLRLPRGQTCITLR